jgi:hypothetical protein
MIFVMKHAGNFKHEAHEDREERKEFNRPLRSRKMRTQRKRKDGIGGRIKRRGNFYMKV